MNLERKGVKLECFDEETSWQLSYKVNDFLKGVIYVDSKIIFYEDEGRGIGFNKRHFKAYIFYKSIEDGDV